MINTKSKTNFNIVLDLDSTAVHTNNKNQQFLDISLYHHDLHDRVRRFDIKNTDKLEHPIELWTIYRPYLKEFLDFCSQYFKNVFIWSAGQHKYVHIIKDFIFTDINTKPKIVYTYEDCIINENTIHKPLDKLFADQRVSGVDITNTLVLDDRYDTFSLNPYNGILIPPYEPKTVDQIRENDDCLLKIIGWLSLAEVRNITDVRYLDKTNIFNTSIQTYIDKLK